MRLLPNLIQKTTEYLVPRLRRLDPLYRDDFDRLVRGPLEALTQGIIRLKTPGTGLEPAQERLLDDEALITEQITGLMNDFLNQEYGSTGRTAERAGNTKTYGLIRGQFSVNESLPAHLQSPLFQPGQNYRAYVRFGGPGPRVVPDIEDNGILSMGIKLMGVPGQKLLDDEQYTIDLSGISSPTFTTPDVRENAKLQQQVRLGTPSWYFLNPFDSHYLDLVMQGLYARAHANPLYLAYYSCVPYLYGEENGYPRAIKFALFPRHQKRVRVGPISRNYLRNAMRATLAGEAVSFDFAIQFQTDPDTMPLENAAIAWSPRDSPFIPIARLDIPPQRFDHRGQDAFARNLTINPWHTIAEHRPLGNQNRARRTIYYATSRTRQGINGERHIEPTGDEQFDDDHPHQQSVANHAEETNHEPV